MALCGFAAGCGGRSGLDVPGAAASASRDVATVSAGPVEAGSSSSGGGIRREQFQRQRLSIRLELQFRLE